MTETGAARIAAGFSAARGRAALMPYLMGGFPDVDTSIAVGLAYADAGADVVELGVPFSDPLADGPVIHAAATRALSAGATVHAVQGRAVLQGPSPGRVDHRAVGQRVGERDAELDEVGAVGGRGVGGEP